MMSLSIETRIVQRQGRSKADNAICLRRMVIAKWAGPARAREIALTVQAASDDLLLRNRDHHPGYTDTVALNIKSEKAVEAGCRTMAGARCFVGARCRCDYPAQRTIFLTRQRVRGLQVYRRAWAPIAFRSGVPPRIKANTYTV